MRRGDIFLSLFTCGICFPQFQYRHEKVNAFLNAVKFFVLSPLRPTGLRAGTDGDADLRCALLASFAANEAEMSAVARTFRRERSE